jgi:quercetin dioxygenase-like cupin family protein
MGNINLTLSLDDDALRKLERLAAREHKDISALVRHYLVSLTEDTATTKPQSQTAAEAKSSAGAAGQAGHYAIDVVAKNDTLRMVTIAIPRGGCVPWHHHSNVTDMFFCLEQPLVIETRAPDRRVELHPGQTYTVARRQPHRVSSADGEQCKFALLQGVGIYDFVPL